MSVLLLQGSTDSLSGAFNQNRKKIIHLFFGHVDIQIPNHHWFKRLSYFYFMFLVLWEKKIWLTHAFISILYILSHWSMRLFLCQYCIVLCNLFLLWTFFIIKCCYIIPLMLPFFFLELTRDLVTFVFAYESHEFEYFFFTSFVKKCHQNIDGNHMGSQYQFW